MQTKLRGYPKMWATEDLDCGLEMPNEIKVGDPAPGKVGVSHSFPFLSECTMFGKGRKIQQSSCRHRVTLIHCVFRDLAQIRRVVCIQGALENSEVAVWNRPATKANRRYEQRPVEQAGEHESVFKSDALVVEPAVGEITQKLFVRLNSRVWLMRLRS